MTNGVSNAAKLTKKGKVELVAQVRDGNFWFEVRARVIVAMSHTHVRAHTRTHTHTHTHTHIDTVCFSACTGV